MLFDAGLQSDTTATTAYRPFALTPAHDGPGFEAVGPDDETLPRFLIRVPTVPHRVRAARPASESARTRLRIGDAPRGAGRPGRRRRLRREVRVVGAALAALVPLALAAALLLDAPSGSSGRRAAVPAAISAGVRPPAVSIMLDATPHAEPESAIVFPGYLLPDEGAEEPAHAGG